MKMLPGSVSSDMVGVKRGKSLGIDTPLITIGGTLPSCALMNVDRMARSRARIICFLIRNFIRT
jgi:hypothetical protein